MRKHVRFWITSIIGIIAFILLKQFGFLNDVQFNFVIGHLSGLMTYYLMYMVCEKEAKKNEIQDN